MTMTAQHSVVVALVALASITDVRTRRIPNVLTFGATIAALLFHVSTGGTSGLTTSVGGWMLGAALFFPVFALRGMGAGDVKLLAAVGAWLGPLPVVWVALVTHDRRRGRRPGRVTGARVPPYRGDELVDASDALAHQRNPAAARRHPRGWARPATGVCSADCDWDGDNTMAQILKTPCARWRSEDGAQLVEFALVLPMLLLVVLGIAEFGFIFQRYEVVTNAAREGARIASLPGYSNADVQARVAAYVTAGRVPTTGTNPVIAVTDVSIPTTPGGPVLTAKRVTVTYLHTYMFLTGIGSWFGATYATVPLTAVSEMRTEIATGL